MTSNARIIHREKEKWNILIGISAGANISSLLTFAWQVMHTRINKYCVCMYVCVCSFSLSLAAQLPSLQLLAPNKRAAADGGGLYSARTELIWTASWRVQLMEWDPLSGWLSLCTQKHTQNDILFEGSRLYWLYLIHWRARRRSHSTLLISLLVRTCTAQQLGNVIIKNKNMKQHTSKQSQNIVNKMYVSVFFPNKWFY